MTRPCLCCSNIERMRKRGIHPLPSPSPLAPGGSGRDASDIKLKMRPKRHHVKGTELFPEPLKVWRPVQPSWTPTSTFDRASLPGAVSHWSRLTLEEDPEDNEPRRPMSKTPGQTPGAKCPGTMDPVIGQFTLPGVKKRWSFDERVVHTTGRFLSPETQPQKH